MSGRWYCNQCNSWIDAGYASTHVTRHAVPSIQSHQLPTRPLTWLEIKTLTIGLSKFLGFLAFPYAATMYFYPDAEYKNQTVNVFFPFLITFSLVAFKTYRKRLSGFLNSLVWLSCCTVFSLYFAAGNTKRHVPSIFDSLFGTRQQAQQTFTTLSILLWVTAGIYKLVLRSRKRAK